MRLPLVLAEETVGFGFQGDECWLVCVRKAWRAVVASLHAMQRLGIAVQIT